MTSKEKYKELCDLYVIPLFSQYWWMEAVCPSESWNVFLYEENGNILASMPYYLGKKAGFRFVIQPTTFTQTNGIWINYPSGLTNYEKYSLEIRVCDYFIKQLSTLRLHYFKQCFHMNFTNWLSFYWNGFSQTTRYTYVIDDISNITDVENSFCGYKKKHLRKSKNLKILPSVTPEQFYEHHTKTLKEKGLKIDYSRSSFIKLYDVAVKRKQGCITAIGDEFDNIYAALFIVWDKNSAYNLITSIDIKYKKSGASTRMVLEAIRYVSDKTRSYDFEGSMIKDVEYSFRQFGTRQKTFFQLEKKYSLIFKLLLELKKKLKQ